MDRKSIIVLILCLVLLVLWYPLVNKIHPPKQRPVSTNQVTTVTNIGTNVPSLTAAGTNVTAQPRARPDEPEKLLTIENDNARYIFTSHGGGIKRIELLQYPESVTCEAKKNGNTNGVAALNSGARTPVLAIHDGAAVEGDGVFELTRRGDGVRAEKSLENGLKLVKVFEPGTNYLMRVSVRLENTSGQALELPQQEWVVGTATPLGPKDDAMAVGLLWYNGAKAESISKGWFDNRFLGCFPGTPRHEYKAGTSNVVWAAALNQFFALTVMPDAPALQVISRSIDLPPPSEEDLQRYPKANRKPKGYETVLVYPAVSLSPGAALEREFHLYSGPKEYKTLAKHAATFNNELDLLMQFGRFFGFFSKALLLSMNAVHSWGLSYGWSIIVITIVIKLLFWPLTNASTKSMKRMAALQPQIKVIQEKYKDDPMKAQRKIMEFWKENKVNPMGSCLPMLLQMPVFIGFFYMIRTAIELRGAGFLWACDLSSADTVLVIPGANFPVNLLPLIMGATMLWQAHLTPPSPGMDPMQQKIMRYMPLMFVVFLYNFSAGLTLYWTVQNLLTILQTKLTKTKTGPATPAPAPAPARPSGPPRKKKK